MKKIGEPITMRGNTAYNTIHRITLFDGRFDTGFRMTDFKIAPVSPTGGVEIVCKVSTAEPSSFTGAYWYWDHNEEIAWAGWGVPNAVYSGFFDNIDPENMIIEDLFLQAYSTTGEAGPVNYEITLQKYDITDWEGALAMVRNQSQG